MKKKSEFSAEEKKPVGREEQEAGEGLPVKKTDAPSERYQTDQQIQNADDAMDTEGVKTSFQKKVKKPRGSQLKQEVAAEVLENTIAGGIPTNISGRYTLSFSGNGGTVIGSASGTPIVGVSDRSDTRFGKKVDATNKLINYVVSEQVLIPFDQSKPLAEARDQVQGYNGTYRAEEARSQKNNGGVPCELYFQRSLDEIKRDHIYFSHGQVVKQEGVVYDDVPTVTVNTSSPGSPNTAAYSISRGNYLPRNLKVTVAPNGKITGMEWDILNCTPDSETQGVCDLASSAEKIFMNQSEIDRQNIDAKAGDEKADLWCPLARAIEQPSQTVGFLRDLENDTGSEVFIAYKKAAMSMSYTINKTAKDGLHAVRPMKEMLQGSIVPEGDSSQFSSDGSYGDNPFQSKYYVNGSAALIIALFDSTGKYVSKADLITLPRALSMHMQTADNNMNPLRVDEKFIAFVNAEEVFSTIDREYDPTAPVMISDNAALMHPYDWNDLYSFTSLNADGTPAFKQQPLRYSYHDLRNNYIVRVAHPLLEGIHHFLMDRGSKLYQLCGGDGTANVTINIPIKHSTTHYSLWSFLVLAATPYILNSRVNSLKDVLYYEKNVEYPFKGLISIKEANPMDAVNYKNGDYRNPIDIMEMIPAARMSWVLPELFWPFDEESADNTYKYVLPWYFNEESFKFSSSGVEFDDTSSNMSYPSTRAGVRLAYLDDVYSMEERDVRLCLDRMVRPVVDGTAGGVYKYSQPSDGIPFVTMSQTQFSYKNFLSTPRELGYFLVAPYATISSDILSTKEYNSYKDGNAGVFGQTSYIAKYWFGAGLNMFAVGGESPILKPTEMNVDRATSYVQNWNALPCVLQTSEDGLKDPGFVLSVGDLFTSTLAPIAGRSQFTPFTDGIMTPSGETPLTGSAYQVMSLQKAMWTRIQKLPMAISPWDAVSSYTRIGEDGMKFDLFDFLYYFGLAGFRSSDYREDTYNRMNQADEQGLMFNEDPWVLASPLYRDAKRKSQV